MIETVVNDKLIDAIIDDAPPKKHQMATQPDPQWVAALARECKSPPVSLADAFTPKLTGMLLNAQLAGSSLSYLQGNASIRASLTTL